MTARPFLAFLALFNIVGVSMGYEGVARLRRLHFPPFRDGLYDIMVSYPPPPNWLVLAWASPYGHVILWAGYLVIPVIIAKMLW